MDYQPQETLLIFGKCDTKSCVNVEIEDNGSPEFVETFMGILTRTENLDRRIIVQPNITTIEIMDNDGKWNWLIIIVVIFRSSVCRKNTSVAIAARINRQFLNSN